MDSSNYHVPPGEGGASATRLALSVDPEAIGLMKHASEIGHLIDSWLQNPAQAIAPMAAYRLGRKLERFRLAARLSEGRASKPVRATLDGLRTELKCYPAPAALLEAIARAYYEAERLEAANTPPATVERKAFTMNGIDGATAAAARGDEEYEEKAAGRGSPLRWVLPGLIVVGGMVVAATDYGPQLLQHLRALLP
ncbi:MAG: hypothetical protein ING52_03620 [Burkholderiales bacterium]|jgi:hypothetical protein|nr:hypothetical protein [Burkholderiales bacterium]MCA3215388.1 hypothetical protein [Burkholderiales bacterium]MCA3224587.1 hypothetical protein [Burkholderiales bacterium]MCE2644014.1 hypothetical protein [Burkholderiaceae bacterium]